MRLDIDLFPVPRMLLSAGDSAGVLLSPIYHGMVRVYGRSSGEAGAARRMPACLVPRPGMTMIYLKLLGRLTSPRLRRVTDKALAMRGEAAADFTPIHTPPSLEVARSPAICSLSIISYLSIRAPALSPREVSFFREHAPCRHYRAPATSQAFRGYRAFSIRMPR